MNALRDAMKPRLQHAADANISYVSGSCKNLLSHWDAMWNFMEHRAVDPTNNHGERELRRLVMWRRRSFGSSSERGDRFVERMMTVTHTIRKNAGDTLSFLYRSMMAMLASRAAPRLLPAS